MEENRSIHHQHFLLEEFKSLRQEIRERASEQANVLKYAVLSATTVYLAIYSLISLSEDESGANGGPTFALLEEVLLILWAIPFLLANLGRIMWQGNNDTILNIARYIMKREREWLGEEGGWEVHVDAVRKSSIWSRVDWMAHIFWPGAIITTGWVPCLHYGLKVESVTVGAIGTVIALGCICSFIPWRRD